MIEEEIRQQTKDEEHLRLLSLGYMVSAGITAFFSMFGLLYVFMGAMFTSVLSHLPQGKHGEGPPAFIGWIFAGMGLAMFVLGFGLAILKWRSAQCLKSRRSLTFCQIVAGVTCLGVPYGTFLGVLTFVVLSRPSVKGLFLDRHSAAK